MTRKEISERATRRQVEFARERNRRLHNERVAKLHAAGVLLPCGYCQHCGYGGVFGEGSPDCLHKLDPIEAAAARTHVAHEIAALPMSNTTRDDVYDAGGTFRLQIALGGDAMCTGHDVAAALVQVAEALEDGRRSGSIYDLNKDRVGGFARNDTPIESHEVGYA